MADNFFCLDISERFIKAIDAKKSGEIIEVNSMGKSNSTINFFSSDAEKTLNDQASIINQLVNNLKIAKKNVNIIIPNSLTYNQILTMPYLNEKELISAIKYQADQFIPMPIEEANIDLEVIEEFKEEKKMLILIVAAEKKLIEKIQTTVELSGLIPESIENELSANARFFQEMFRNNKQAVKQNFLVVNFGFNTSNIFYIEKEKLILKESHNFNLGYQLFLKEIKINTDIDGKKAAEILQNFSINNQSSYPVETIINPLLKEFTAEIKRFIGSKKVDIIYFINHSAYFPELPSLLQKSLSVQTTVFNPFNLIKKSIIIDSLKLDLPLYISTLGGNLR